MSQLDLAHLQRVQRILETFSDVDVPHAMIACEDAYVALSLGFDLGLSVEQISRNNAEIITRGNDADS